MSTSNQLHPRLENWRFLVIYTLIGIIFGFYALRLFNLQILRGDQFVASALENRKTDIFTSTQRGIIYDRNGFILANNIPSYNIVITPALLPGDPSDLAAIPGNVQQIYRQLSDLIGIPVNKGVVTDETAKAFIPCTNDLGIEQIVYIWDIYKPYTPVRIKCNVDQSEAMIVREKAADWPGVDVEVESVRDYPTGNLTSEIIGFLGPIPASEKDYFVSLGFVVGRDKVGFAGIESSMQEELGGRTGLQQVEVDSAGQTLRDLAPVTAPIPGDNVVLTIDTRLQLAARTALVGDINSWNTRLGKIQSTNGVVIAMNPRTGEILAMVSYPTFDNNRMARAIPLYYYEQLLADPNRPLFNHAISAELPPGSVFKMAAAIGALNEGVVTPDYIINDPGRITIIEKYYENDPGKPRDYVCWNLAGHGEVDFLKGVAQSCDVYFYKIGGGYQNEVPNGGLGPWRMAEYAKALGYGALTGIELDGEAKGNIPDPKWKRITIGENWSTGDTYIGTIGQGYVLATPLQVLESFTTIANDGVMMQPTLIKEILGPDGKVVKPFTPVVRWDITKDAKVQAFNQNLPTGEMKTVAPWVLQILKQGLRMVVTEGTAMAEFEAENAPGSTLVQSAGKTGTAEYCDDIAMAQNLCKPQNWPAHAWYIGYAPYDNPEIAVVAFVYNGREGSTFAAPIVEKILRAYFELKAVDAGQASPAS